VNGKNPRHKKLNNDSSKEVIEVVGKEEKMKEKKEFHQFWLKEGVWMVTKQQRRGK